jgi:hypothetical protein
MKITARRAALAAALPLIAAILEYGYWFNRTHGALLVSVTDLSDRAHPRDFPSVQLTFLDGSGKELAGAESVPPFEAIVLTSPSSFACLEAERRALLGRRKATMGQLLRAPVPLAPNVDSRRESCQSALGRLRDRAIAGHGFGISR